MGYEARKEMSREALRKRVVEEENIEERGQQEWEGTEAGGGAGGMRKVRR